MDRIVVIGDGRIVADMKPDALLSGDTLKEQGIREPLYITALKHAGCAIREEYRPSHVETMDFEPYKTQVKEWFETTETKNVQPKKTGFKSGSLKFFLSARKADPFGCQLYRK